MKDYALIVPYLQAKQSAGCTDLFTQLTSSPITRIIVSDTIPQPVLALPEFPGKRIEVISTAALFAEAILRIHEGESVSSLFVNKKGGYA